MKLMKPTKSLGQALRYWWPRRLTLDFPNRPAHYAWLWWGFGWRNAKCGRCQYEMSRKWLIWLPFMQTLYCEGCLPGVVATYAAEKEADAIAEYDAAMTEGTIDE